MKNYYGKWYNNNNLLNKSNKICKFKNEKENEIILNKYEKNL